MAEPTKISALPETLSPDENAEIPISDVGVTRKVKISTLISAIGVQSKLAADVATTAALPSCTYDNGSSGAGATLTATANGVLTVDGVAVASGTTVLVKNQAAAAQNGLYVCTQAGAADTPFVLTRHGLMDNAAEIRSASVTVSEAGTTNRNTTWQSNVAYPAVVGTSAITFTKFVTAQIAPSYTSTTRPTSAAGTIIYETNTARFAFYNGSAWFYHLNRQGDTMTGVLNVQGAINAQAAGTGLSVTNNATIGGTLTATGNISTSGTLSSVGTFTVNTSKMVVNGSTGNTTIAGVLGLAGDFTVNTNKFNVSAATGNTTVAGTLNVTGLATLTAGASIPQGVALAMGNYSAILTGSDGASFVNSNMRLRSWWGVGFSPQVSNQPIPVGLNSIYMDVRQGNFTAYGVGRINSTFVANASRIYISAGNVVLDAGGRIAALSSSTPVSGGSGAVLNERFYDSQGNTYTATGVDGSGVVTEITMNAKFPIFSTPPSNPVALTSTTSGGATGVTVNLTWTQYTQLKLNPSGDVSIPNTLQVNGDLIVSGSLTVNSTTTTVPTNTAFDFSGGSGQYLQYITTGTPRLRYVASGSERFSIGNDGLVTLAGPLKMGSVTATGFGKDVGLIPIWDSIDGSNSIFGLNTAKRMVIRRAQASIADNNFADLQISRSTPSLASGSTQANNILYVLGDYGTGDWSNNRGVLVQLGSHQTVGHQIGIWSEIKRYSDGTVPMWALILNTRDQTGLASSAPGMKQNVTAEIGLRSNKADNGSNASNLGGVGIRRAIHVVAGRDITTDMTENEIAHGLWFGTSDVTDTYDPYTTYLSVIGLGINGPNGVHTYQVLDTRGAQAPTGYTDPVAAVRMNASQVIDFNGGNNLKAPAGNYLQYTTSGTSRLRYMVGNTQRFSISDTGSITLNGNTVNDGTLNVGGLAQFNNGLSIISGKALTLNNSNTISSSSGDDAATFAKNNLSVKTWQGFGIGPSVAGQVIPVGLYALWLQARNGSLDVYGSANFGNTVTANAGRLFYSGANYYLNAGGRIATLASSTPADGGEGFSANTRFYDSYGNTYTATAVDGTGAVTTITMNGVRPWHGAAPATLVDLLLIPDGTPSGVSVNLVWTQITNLVLNQTGNVSVAHALTVNEGVSVGGTLNTNGDFSINANKFTVEATTGNTSIAGTLDGTGSATFGGNVVAGIGSSGTINGVFIGSVSNAAVVQPVSASANCILRLMSKGTSSVQLMNGASEILGVFSPNGVSSPVNYLMFAPSQSGLGPMLFTGGSDANRDVRIVPAGQGVVKVPSIHTGGPGNTFTLSGTQAPNQYAFVANYNIAGTLAAGNSFTGTKVVVNSDTLKLGTPAPNGVNWFEVVGNLSAGFAGPRAGISSSISVNGTQDTSIAVNDDWCHWVSALSTIQISKNQGGTSPDSGSSRGIVYGGGDQVWALDGATNLTNVIGREIDVGLWGTASAAQRLGLLIVSYGEKQGAVNDSAIRISANQYNAGIGWKRVISLYGRAVDPAGEILAYLPYPQGSLPSIGEICPPPVAARGINLQAYKFTDAAMVLPAGFRVEPDGSISLGPATITTSTTNFSLDTIGHKLSSVDAVVAGNAFVVNDQVWSLDGTILKVDSVNGSGRPTAFTIIQRGGVKGSAPTNPVTFYGGTGIGLTVNLNWTQITTLTLQSSGGLTSVGGKLAISSNAVDAVTSTGGAVFGTGNFRRIYIMPNGVNNDPSGEPNVLDIRRVGGEGAGTDKWVTRSAWTQTATTPGTGIRYNMLVETNQSAGIDPGETWGLTSIMRTRASVASHVSTAAYFQTVRTGLPTSGEGVNIIGTVIEVRDQTNQTSSVGGIMLGLEIDLVANGADDHSPDLGRGGIAFVLQKDQSSGVSPTFSHIIGVFPKLGDNCALNNGILFGGHKFNVSLFNTRESTQAAGANAIWLKTGHRIALDGDTIGTASTNYIYYDGAATCISAALKVGGTLTLAADPTTALQAATKQYVNNTTLAFSTITTGAVDFNSLSTANALIEIRDNGGITYTNGPLALSKGALHSYRHATSNHLTQMFIAQGNPPTLHLRGTTGGAAAWGAWKPIPVGQVIVDTIAALRIVDVTGFSATSGISAYVRGYTTAGDGGGGDFVWSPSSTETDDSFIVFKPQAISAGNPGRWRRVITGGVVTPEMAGAVGDYDFATNTGTNDWNAFFRIGTWASFTSTNGHNGVTVQMADKKYLLTNTAGSTLNIPPGIRLVGAGAIEGGTNSLNAIFYAGTIIALDPTVFLNFQSRTAMTDVKVMRRGLLAAPTNSDVATLWQTTTPAEGSVGVRANGSRPRFERVTIVGFTTGIELQSGSGGATVRDCLIDCYNGLSLTGSGDTTVLDNVRLIPVYMPLSGSGNWRRKGGIGFNLFDQADCTYMNVCQSGGHAIGLRLSNTWGVNVQGMRIEAQREGLQAGDVCVLIEEIASFTQFNDCYISGMVCFDIKATDSSHLVGASTIHQTSSHITIRGGQLAGIPASGSPPAPSKIFRVTGGATGLIADTIINAQGVIVFDYGALNGYNADWTIDGVSLYNIGASSAEASISSIHSSMAGKVRFSNIINVDPAGKRVVSPAGMVTLDLVSSPTTGGSHTIPDGTEWCHLTPAGTLATYTITMPPNPWDRAEIEISTTQTITTLTISANTGHTIDNPATTLPASGVLRFRYQAATSQWVRLIAV